MRRRAFLAMCAGSAALTMPFLRGAHAAGSLRVAFWDHWMPGANDVLTRLCKEWATKERVDIAIDFITSQGDKLALTGAAEAQARSGHDVMTFPMFSPAAFAEKLEPMDDVMAGLIGRNGAVSDGIKSVGIQEDHWVAAPITPGSATFACCARMDFFKQYAGLDLAQMYPAGAHSNKQLASNWDWNFFLSAAERCAKAGYPFGMPLGITNDSVNWVDLVLRGHGAALVDEDGNVTVKSDATRQALDWFRKLVPFLPADIWAWDDASNNKWLILGKGALIMNPPSAWAVAVRDAPIVANQLWTFPCPKGAKGRFDAGLPFFWGVWSFSNNKSAAKSLITFLSQAEATEQLVAASHGYDVPPFSNLHNFRTWAEEGPPRGTIYHYPPREDVETSIAYTPAPTAIAREIYAQAIVPKMIAQCTSQGKTVERAMDWAVTELESIRRNVPGPITRRSNPRPQEPLPHPGPGSGVPSTDAGSGVFVNPAR